MFGIDCHTHSGNSPDGTGTVGGLCRRAISLGLEALAITEHIELNRWHSQGYYGTTPRNDEEEYSYYKRMEKAMKDNHAAKTNPFLSVFFFLYLFFCLFSVCFPFGTFFFSS